MNLRVIPEKVIRITAEQCYAGLVDRISGDRDKRRDKRLAKSEAEYEAYKDALKRQQGEQLDIFGVAS